MSQENVERLRAGLTAFNRGGATDEDFLAEDFELHQASSIVDTAGVFHGRGALRGSLRELRESFDDLRFEAEKFIEAPGGEVVVLVHRGVVAEAAGWTSTTTSPGYGPFAVTRQCDSSFTRSKPKPSKPPGSITRTPRRPARTLRTWPPLTRA